MFLGSAGASPIWASQTNVFQSQWEPLLPSLLTSSPTEPSQALRDPFSSFLCSLFSFHFAHHYSVWLGCHHLSVSLYLIHRILAQSFSANSGDVSHFTLGVSCPNLVQMSMHMIPATWLWRSMYAGLSQGRSFFSPGVVNPTFYCLSTQITLLCMIKPSFLSFSPAFSRHWWDSLMLR